MNLKYISTIWKKELRDTVRDRRTLISMILVPMVMMPLITIGMFRLMQEQAKRQESQIVKVVLEGEKNSEQLATAIRRSEKLEILTIESDPKEAVEREEIDGAIIIPEGFGESIANQAPASVLFFSKSTNLNAANAFAAASAAISDFNANLLSGRFEQQEIDPAVLSGAVLVQEDVATQKELGGFLLGLLIPLFIVMWAIVGGQYTAIDVSAGEKERKTLEALLLTPAKRIDIVAGKFLAVSTVALTSIVVAIGSLYISFLYAGDLGMMQNGGANVGGPAPSADSMSFAIEPQVAIILFVVSLFLVLMFSAFILSISIYAKSFKEAQSYIGPAYIAVVLPITFVNAVPGFEPSLAYFAVPAVNAILLFKEVLMGVYNTEHIFLTLGSLIVYSAAAIFIATKIYSKESVLFRD